MCNACGNICCGSDMFGGCGCDGCEEEECWSDETDFDDRPDDEDYGFPPYDLARCCPPRTRLIVCEGISS